MILMLSVRLAGTVHSYLYAYAPTNILVRWLRGPNSQRLALPVSGVLAVVYGLFGASLTSTLNSGGPGWLNLFVLLCAWNTIKFGWMFLASAAFEVRRVVAHTRSRRSGPQHGA